MMDMKSANEFGRVVAEQTEKLMVEQLGDLVTSGLLVWESTTPAFSMDYLTNKITVSQLGRFRLRDQEGFDRLKTENEALRKRLHTIETALRAHP